VRVLFATHYRGVGGGETSLLNLMAALATGGGIPFLACPPGELMHRAVAAGVRTLAADLELVRRACGRAVPKASPTAVLRLAVAMRRHRVAVAHAESFPALCYLGPAARLARRPCVATCHGYWPLGRRIVRRFLPRLAQSFQAVSAPVAAGLAPVAGAERVRLIPLGVAPDFFAADPGRVEARRRLGLDPDERVVLNVARFEPVKGHDILLDALARLADGGFRPLVLLAGGLLEPAGPTARRFRQTIAARAGREPLAGRVRLLGPRDDVPLLMRAADVLVVPSRQESFGMTVVEAMASGTPVIATRCGGPEELLRDAVTGRLVRREDAVALARAIGDAFARTAETRAMAAAARDEARRRFGPEARLRLVLDDYARLAAASTAGRARGRKLVSA